MEAMVTRFLTWVAVFGFSVLAACGAPQAPASADAPSPVSVVDALYQPYLTPHGTAPAWYQALPMTPELASLVSADQHNANGEEGAIDADPIVAAQDFELSDLAVTADTPSPDGRTVVTAHFKNMGRMTEVRFDMVQRPTDHAWLVDNVRSGDANLRAQLHPGSRAAAP